MAILNRKKVLPEKHAFAPRETPPKPFLAAMVGLFALLLTIALLDYTPVHNPILSTAAQQGSQMGVIGTRLAFILFTWLGIAAWACPLLVFGVAYLLAGKLRHTLNWKKVGSASILLVSLAGFAALIEAQLLPLGFIDKHYPNFFIQGLGGFIGFVLFNEWLSHNLGPLGSGIIFSALFCLGITGIFAETPFLSWLRARRAQIKKRKEEAYMPKEQEAPLAAIPKIKTSRQKAEPAPLTPKTTKTLNAKLEEIEPIQTPPEQEPLKQKEPNPQSNLKIVSSEPTQKAIDFLPTQRGSYVFPPLSLLAEPPPPPEQHLEDHQQTAAALLQTLSEFGVKVALGEIHTGPVITRYEVTPAPGVRVEKIASLDKNIALGLCATSVRILAPVPGKGSVGIEIPNKTPSPVCLREIIESTSWAHSKAEIPIVLGKDVTGRPIVTDLTKMPHMLIAGSTGAGKTVCINAIIASLLYHSSPEDLRFIMVDPKIVEMQLYNSLPHMLIPVVTNPKLVPGALKWLIAEMERRYQLFAQMGVRNIAGFNAKVLKDKEEEQRAAEMDAELSAEERAAISNLEVPRDINLQVPRKKIPYIVCIIDELADLMMVAPADIETCVARLAQLARAAGIHLILATQRPSVNVITGVIKANLPSRIAFKVASKVDSRTILDMGGADTLIGRGDMLFTPPGSAHLVRAQGAFVSDEESGALVEFLKRNGPPQYVEEVQREVENSAQDKDSREDEWDDELVPAALDVLRNTQRASTSILQRKLSIGYNRAARIMEILEDRGIVGPENGAKPREILRDLNSL